MPTNLTRHDHTIPHKHERDGIGIIVADVCTLTRMLSPCFGTSSSPWTSSHCSAESPAASSLAEAGTSPDTSLDCDDEMLMVRPGHASCHGRRTGGMRDMGGPWSRSAGAPCEEKRRAPLGADAKALVTFMAASYTRITACSSGIWSCNGCVAVVWAGAGEIYLLKNNIESQQEPLGCRLLGRAMGR